MPYMRLVSSTESFRLPIPEDAIATTHNCQCIRRAVDVIVVRFCILEKLKLQFCNCRPAAVQLLQRGLFPSAPFAPSLAVDIRVLDFVSRLFLHVSPNATAWCNTVEEFLQSQGYKLTTQDSLRRRFSEALKWYNGLQDATTKHVGNVLYHVRTIITGYNDGSHTTAVVSLNESTPRTTQPPRVDAVEGNPAPEFPLEDALPNARLPRPLTPLGSSTVPPSTPIARKRHRSEDTSTRPPPVTMVEIEDEDALPNARHPRPSTPLNSSTVPPSTPISRKRHCSEDTNGWKRHRSEDTDGLRTPFPMPIPRDRPSDYLRSWCPLCFGGDPNQRLGGNVPDIIVCVDACFKQKENEGQSDPPREHPRSVFISDATASKMEEYVEGIRLSKAKKGPKRQKPSDSSKTDHDSDEEDGYDGPLKVPQSVLAGCEKSFTAANETREKASTQFFAVTALMALLCRHDRVIWIVNM
ncbi:uncharacterized protein LACBIDRAFT_304591 [Laccaria bicolor S238N-H82]|uniref:Predicted protein n=1 Tax=Laccaria bicolor (strain S238N-H82 / ATCC MYA-4686) TaxID=486041 RepID=B0DLY9_LACBS|nr:uncharacterized protein LACBIDRAFT_304591 [Laccaria bicolor S238N-H82]EDR04478.1 predicted protein [Laccaria bicolor S238N-H82]|eukprot:XP_001884997.1 predicted protein [Laccaria bicolor S238N-H82]